jgi:F-type H+-transporting ATPase subunit epsilon
MAENIKLEVVTPEKYVVSEDAQIVMAPGSLGEFGVLRGHTPFLTSLKIGRLHFKDTSGQERELFVSGGFAEALPDRVTVLAESAERRSEIDLERARAALERAQKRLAEEKAENINFERARAAMYRAMERIKVAETTHS